MGPIFRDFLWKSDLLEPHISFSVYLISASEKVLKSPRINLNICQWTLFSFRYAASAVWKSLQQSQSSHTHSFLNSYLFFVFDIICFVFLVRRSEFFLILRHKGILFKIIIVIYIRIIISSSSSGSIGGGTCCARVESLYTESYDNFPKSYILCPNWTHLYTAGLSCLWETLANFPIIAFHSRIRE